MNGLWIVFLLVVLGGAIKVATDVRNEKFARNPAAVAEAISATNRFAEQSLKPGENLLLSDYSHQMNAYVLITDQGIYYKQSGRNSDRLFSTTYHDIIKCEFKDASLSKCRSDQQVASIHIKAQRGKCVLMTFPKIKEMAAELARQGFEKKSMVSGH